MEHTYWQIQTATKALFPDIEWNRPEQKTKAGRLLIIGGNSFGFVAVAESYQEAVDTGAGQVRAILPDSLKKSLPPTLTDAIFVPGNSSGGISREAITDVKAALEWCDHCLLIGDAGRNSESAMTYEAILKSEKPLTITRDAIDLLRPASQQMVDRDLTTLVMSFAQLQKLFQTVYYPKILSFSMQLNLLVESLHKFTITYPVTIVTYHQNQMIIAHNGDVVTQEFTDPMKIWRGSTATKVACYQLWTPSKPLQAATASLV